MNEKQIISQLKGLRTIKPGQDWAVLVKNDLLSEPIELVSSSKIPRETVFSFFARPAFVVSAALVVGFAIMGALAYFGLQKNTYDLQAFIDKLASQNQESKQAIASLQDAQSKMDEIKAVLIALKTEKDPKKVLVTTEVIKATAKNSQQTIDTIQAANTGLSKQVKASLGKIKESSAELEKTSADLQIEMFKTYLAELKTKTLSVDDQERLKNAETYFKDGKIDEAIILLMKIGEGVR